MRYTLNHSLSLNLLIVDGLFSVNYKQLDGGLSLDNLRQSANERKCQNIELKNNVAKNRQWLDMKMGEQKVLYDRMVANYHRMIAKSQVSAERLDRASAKNDQFQVVARYLAERIEELTNCHVLPVGSSTDNSCSLNGDDAQSFEVSRLVDLYAIRKQ